MGRARASRSSLARCLRIAVLTSSACRRSCVRSMQVARTPPGALTANGVLADMATLGVWEPVAVKQQTIKTAVESASMLLRIDEIVSGTHKPEKKKAVPAAAPEGGDDGQ